MALALIHQQASSGVQKRCYFSIEPVLIFDIGKVRGVELSISRTRNVIREKGHIDVALADEQSFHVYPLLRKPAAIPSMVGCMPCTTRSSVSPV